MPPPLDLHSRYFHREHEGFIDYYAIEKLRDKVEDRITIYWARLNSDSNRLQKGGDDSILMFIIFSYPSSKYRDDRSSFHAVIDLARVSIASMLRSRRMYATSILDIEISTLHSCSLHEESCRMIEDIIGSTAESVTPLTHSSRGRGHGEKNERMKTKEFLLTRFFLILVVILKNPKRNIPHRYKEYFF